MAVFDSASRSDTDDPLYAEPSFDYLNRSARPEAGKVRALLEFCFRRYPQEHRLELRGRLRSRNDFDHHSAFFELFLHDLLLRIGCTAEVHPDVPGTTKRPDFLVRSKNGSQFYLEAVLAGESRSVAAAKARINTVYDILNGLESLDFMIGMELKGLPRTPPRARHIKAFLESRLQQVDTSEIATAFEEGGFDILPRWLYEHEGWNVAFFPIPIAAEATIEPNDRVLGLFLHGAETIDSTSIKHAVFKKAGRYGDLKLPYVIAVDLLKWLPENAGERALFGSITWNFTKDMTYVGQGRNPDGAWGGPRNPKNTRVSAVLLVRRLTPWSVSRSKIQLFLNPRAKRPCDSELNRFPRFDERTGSWDHGASSMEIFELSLDWPED